MADQKTALITGVTGPGRRLSVAAAARSGLCRPWHQTALFVVQHRPDRASLPGPAREGCALPPPLCDLTDSTNLIRIIQETRPHEIYNLAAQSHVAVSFETPEYTANADAVGTLRLLEAIRILDIVKTCRFYQASTSELFGLAQEIPQRESTPFYPRSPYAAAKLYAY